MSRMTVTTVTQHLQKNQFVNSNLVDVVVIIVVIIITIIITI